MAEQNLSKKFEHLNLKFSDFELKGAVEWNKTDVKEWIQSLRYKKELEIKLLSTCDEFGINGEILISLKRKELEKDWHLNTFSTLCFYNAIVEAQEMYRRFHNVGSKNIKLTNDNDIITQLNDGPPRTLMPCNHAVSASSLFKYIKHEFKKPNTFDIYCPDTKCHTLWNWDLCCEIANLTADELQGFELLRMERKKIKKCPGCKNFTDPPDNWIYFRVNCGHKCPDFCWNCGLPWKGTGSSSCGNEECDNSTINSILASATMKSDGFPSIRACPKCNTLIEHIQACKHMLCLGCKTSFCFRCLCVKDSNGSWGCDYNCELKPTQVINSKKCVQ